jgi:hypothetical protein
MTENEAIEVFNEILSVPDEILLKYKNALDEDKENALIKLKCAQILAVRCLKEIQMYRDGKLSLVPSDVFKRKCEELDDYKEIGTVEELKNIQNKTISDLIKTIEKEFDSFEGDSIYLCEDGTIIETDSGYVSEWFREYKEVIKRRYGI